MRTLPDPYVLAFLLADGLVVLLLYNRLLAAVRGSFTCCSHGVTALLEMLGNAYVIDSVRLMFLLLTPFYALTLVVTGVSTVGFFFTLASLAAFFLFRKLVCTLLGWLGSRPGEVRSLERLGYAVCVLAILLSLPAAVVVWLVPATPRIFLWGWLILIAVLALGVYAIKGFSLFFSSGFSRFFWVLYLCALEILPICVVVSFLMHGN